MILDIFSDNASIFKASQQILHMHIMYKNETFENVECFNRVHFMPLSRIFFPVS